MQAVSKENIAQWIRQNEQGVCGSLALKPKYEDRPQIECKPRKPWYEQEPRPWFKPIFAALLFARQRWEAFAMVGVLGVVFGLAWWMTCLWLG